MDVSRLLRVRRDGQSNEANGAVNHQAMCIALNVLEQTRIVLVRENRRRSPGIKPKVE